MNIFVLSEDPREAAQAQCNKHVVKMIVESAQMLCTALSINGTDKSHLPYKSTHVKHPCTLWTASSNDNIDWLWTHAIELCAEYTKRYGKKHKTEYVLENMAWLIPKGDWHNHTPFALAMPEQFKHNDAVIAYRCYYIAEKSKIAKWWPRASPPTWWPFKEEHSQDLQLNDEERVNAI